MYLVLNHRTPNTNDNIFGTGPVEIATRTERFAIARRELFAFDQQYAPRAGQRLPSCPSACNWSNFFFPPWKEPPIEESRRGANIKNAKNGKKDGQPTGYNNNTVRRHWRFVSLDTTVAPRNTLDVHCCYYLLL